jgi:hypothetical protein
MPGLSALLAKIPDEYKPVAALGIGAAVLVFLVLLMVLVSTLFWCSGRATNGGSVWGGPVLLRHCSCSVAPYSSCFLCMWWNFWYGRSL